MWNIFKSMSPPEVDFREWVASGAQIIDVRTMEEFNSGHIPQSINIPLSILPGKISFLKEKNKKIITVCRSGNRSAMAKTLLESKGLEVANGGAWDDLSRKLNKG